MLVREAQVGDIDQMVAIEGYCYDHPWPREAFEEEIENAGQGIGFIAEQEGFIVGFATGLEVSDEFHLHNIAVHPDYQGQGVGKELLKNIDDYCHEHDLHKILLEVRRDNENARRLYLGMGYEAVGIRKDYYGPGRDAYLFTKVLAQG